MHMMCHHLGLGQLWRCPVEWCAVWKGSIRDCRDHFNEKHSGSETLDFDKVSKTFPAWTVTRDVWKAALRPEVSGIAMDVKLFHEAGKRLVHKYRVYRDPWPHPALRNGRITKLISLVNRAMVIAQLTQLRIAIPLSGHVPGEVPIDCFPKVDEQEVIKSTKRVSFADGDQPSKVPADLPTVEAEDQLMDERVDEDLSTGSPVPPPGFRRFEWPQVEWTTDSDTDRDPGLQFVAEWSAIIAKEEESYPDCARPDTLHTSAPVPTTNERIFHK